jgi:hypothetical protein
MPLRSGHCHAHARRQAVELFTLPDIPVETSGRKQRRAMGPNACRADAPRERSDAGDVTEAPKL